MGQRRRVAVHAGVLSAGEARARPERVVRPVVPPLRHRSAARRLDRARDSARCSPTTCCTRANDTDIDPGGEPPSGTLPPVSDALFTWPLMRAELEYVGIRTPADLALFRVATRRAYAPLLETGRDQFRLLPVSRIRRSARALSQDRAIPSSPRWRAIPCRCWRFLSRFDPPRATQPSATPHALPSPIRPCRARQCLRGSAGVRQRAPLPPEGASLPFRRSKQPRDRPPSSLRPAAVAGRPGSPRCSPFRGR